MDPAGARAQLPANIVRVERLRREWSVRTASAAGGISNTYWGEFEDYRRPMTPYIAEAVAKAFKWPENWLELHLEREQEARRGLAERSHGDVLLAVADEISPPVRASLDRLWTAIVLLAESHVEEVQQRVGELRLANGDAPSATEPPRRSRRRG